MLCVITNNAEKAGQTIAAFQSLKHGEKTLAVAPKKVADSLETDYAVSEEEFREAHPRIPFQGNYGGTRNIALAACHALDEDAIFFDDDVRPVNDPVKKHLTLLQHHDAVLGKYVGHAGGTLSCLLSLTREYAKKEPDQQVIKNYLSNIPQPSGPKKGLAAGNTAISRKAMPLQCFYPTSYRVEDALYIGLSQYYGFTAYDPPDPPLVEHVKKGSPGGLAKALQNEVVGSAIAQCISRIVKQKAEPDPQTAASLKKSCFEKSWEYYSLDYAQKKLPENQDTKPIHELRLQKLVLPDDEFFSQVKKFFDAQKQWRPALESVRAGEFKC